MDNPQDSVETPAAGTRGLPVPTPPPCSAQIQRSDINEWAAITVVPDFAPPDPRAGIAFSPEGQPGVYRVTFVLAVPGKDVFRADLDIERMTQSGDSLLAVPVGRHFKVEISNGTRAEIDVAPNADGKLATAVTRVTAASFQESQRFAWNLVMPMLSWWSYRYDAALDITGYEVLEEATQAQRWVGGVLSKVKPFAADPSEGNLHSRPEYRTLFASYREALGATNLFYRFLCFYKVVEGCYGLRAQRRQAIHTAGQAYREPTEEIPADLSAFADCQPYPHVESFRPYAGRRFTRVRDELRAVMRNAIAHIDPENLSVVADNFDDVAACEKAAPVIKYMARQMLRNELVADGIVQPSFIV
jgi:hypothetical protein